LEEKELLASENKNYRILLLVGALFGLLGSIALAVGMFISFGVVSGGVDVFGIVIVTIVLGIAIVHLLTFIGTLSPRGLMVNDERPALFSLALFIFAPITIISGYATPLYYLLEQGNLLLVSADYGFYITFIGAAFMLIAFFFMAWIFAWKNRLSTTGGLNLGGGNEIVLVRILRILMAILSIFAAIGTILGLCLSIYQSGSTPVAALLYSAPAGLDLKALAFIILLGGTFFTSLFVLLSNLNVLKTTRSELPLLAFVGLLIFMPGYTPPGVIIDVWSSPIYELLNFLNLINSTSTQTLTAIGWILFTSILIFILALIIGVLTFYFARSATSSPRAPKTTGALEAKKKKGKFPTGPPSAPVGDLSSTLSASAGPSGPPSMSGPPSSSQPVVSSEPPTPPTFIPTTSTASVSGPPSETPTCPFCGKTLRFIEEYQRWYCDSCAQYV